MVLIVLRTNVSFKLSSVCERQILQEPGGCDANIDNELGSNATFGERGNPSGAQHPRRVIGSNRLRSLRAGLNPPHKHPRGTEILLKNLQRKFQGTN